MKFRYFEQAHVNISAMQTGARITGKIGLNFWLRSIADLTRLIYPENCVVCKEELSSEETCCCAFCLDELPYSHFEKYTEPTALDKLFWGRLQLQATYSLLIFEKKSAAQEVLHSLKYGNNSKLGSFMGGLIGNHILQMGPFADAELLIPVPIHHRKRFTRGYNQSMELARGISMVTGIPVNEHILSKTSHSTSQTRKGRFLRWDNVQEMFSANSNLKPDVKHVVIVDDVITTGATLEALVRVFQEKYPDIRVSVISLAFTK